MAVPADIQTKPRIRGCTGKKRYRSASDAVVFASRASRKLGAMRPYACPHCRYWHLTTEVTRRFNKSDGPMALRTRGWLR